MSTIVNEGQPIRQMSELAAGATAAADAIVTVDQKGRITSWNPAAERLLGYSAADAVGQTLALIIPPQYRARHVAAFDRAMDTGTLAHHGVPARVEATRGSGETLALVFTLGLLKDESGTPTGAVAVLRTIDEPISFAEGSRP
jgi:PAS domain S-box-containing protein